MVEGKNSEIIKHVLDTLINISSRKTTKGHALFTMNELMQTLREKYNFLKHIEINDNRFSESQEPITIMSDINSINTNEIGDALYDIIKTMNLKLGKEAGHFFIKELKNNLQENYGESFEEMGLDLGLMQLEYEINELTKKIQK